jgi:hypothetical protein
VGVVAGVEAPFWDDRLPATALGDSILISGPVGEMEVGDPSAVVGDPSAVVGDPSAVVGAPILAEMELCRANSVRTRRATASFCWTAVAA